MAGRLEGKVVLVTGCGSSGPGWGIGKAVCVRLAREGARIFGCDLHAEAAEETRSIIAGEGGRCEVMAADVSSSEAWQMLVAASLEQFGRIDVLVNNVGISAAGGPVEYPEHLWRRDLDINVTSMFLSCKYVIPHMERLGGGSIVNMGSVSGIRSVLGMSPLSYDTSKAAILGFSRSVALRYASRGIRSNVVMPGLINTPMLFGEADAPDPDELGRQCPMGRLGEAWDVAEAVLYLASDASKYVTATELLVDGGIAGRFALPALFDEQ